MLKKKRLRNLAIAAAIIVIAGTGGTLAYLSAVTETKTNIFTMGTGITGQTDEPGWKEETALNFVPGKVIAKDPEIKNTSADTTEPVYAAAKITYQKKDASGNWVDTTYANLDRFINIRTKTKTAIMEGFNTSAWSVSDDYTAVYYNQTLPSGQTTEKIFTEVEIDPLALTPEQVKSADEGGIVQFDQTKYEEKDAQGNVTGYTYKNYEMGDFQITVTGYLCQTEGFSSVKEAMSAAFPAVFN